MTGTARHGYACALLASAALTIAAAFPAVADQPPPAPNAPPALLQPLTPAPQQVRAEIVSLSASCAAWLHDLSSLPKVTSGPKAGPETEICDFVLDRQGLEWRYAISGGLIALLTLVPAGFLAGAAGAAVGAGFRRCRSALAWLSVRVSRS